MKEIQLTKGFKTEVDDQDYEWLIQWKWHVHRSHNTYYAVRCPYINGKKTNVFMHNEITNPPLGKETDHINLNGLDNKRSNLRHCTEDQNKMNRKPYGKSKYKGVWFDKGRPRSSIQINKKVVRIGTFVTEEEAALAYNIKAKEYFGEFAYLNILPESIVTKLEL